VITIDLKIGIVDMSGSNQSYEYRQFYSFHNNFWTYNPKAKYKFPPQHPASLVCTQEK